MGCDCRGDYEKIAMDLETKTIDDVKSYSAVFWKECHKLPDHEKMMAAIERGEARMRKLTEAQDQLTAFVQHYRDDSDFHWPKSKSFTKEEDAFIVTILSTDRDSMLRMPATHVLFCA